MDKVLLGLKIRQLREQKNLTQMQLAETIEMSDRALSNIEVAELEKLPTFNAEAERLSKELNAAENKLKSGISRKTTLYGSYSDGIITGR